MIIKNMEFENVKKTHRIKKLVLPIKCFIFSISFLIQIHLAVK